MIFLEKATINVFDHRVKMTQVRPFMTVSISNAMNYLILLKKSSRRDHHAAGKIYLQCIIFKTKPLMCNNCSIFMSFENSFGFHFRLKILSICNKNTNRYSLLSFEKFKNATNELKTFVSKSNFVGFLWSISFFDRM